LRKILILAAIVAIILIAGCAKQAQKEIPANNAPVENMPAPTQPTNPAIANNSSTQAQQENTPAQQTSIAPQFISEINCTPGSFKFKITNIGDEKFSTSKLSMLIAAKVFVPTCDADVLEPNATSSCSVVSYLKGKFSVKIEAELFNNSRSFIEHYFNNTISCSGVN